MMIKANSKEEVDMSEIGVAKRGRMGEEDT
jgi:hypothetical protein